jgi:hypothetical protein
MLACAGFDVFQREEYCIIRSYAQDPSGWIENVFPYLNTWRLQVNELYITIDYFTCAGDCYWQRQ